MSERKVMTWADLGQLFDGPHATPTRVTEGPYFLNISSLSDGRLDLTQSDHVSPDDFAQWTRRVTPAEDDLLFSYETRLGEAALMPARVEACLGRRMALLRPDRLVVDPKFLLYYYLSPDFQQLIEQHTIPGATVNRIGLSTMGTWPVSLPSLPEQQTIAEVLGALDDKIAANTKLAATATHLVRAEFQCLMKSADRRTTIGQILSLEYGKSLAATKRLPGLVDVFGSGGIVGKHDSALLEGPGVIVGRKGTAGAVHWSAGPYFPIDTTYYVVPRAEEVSQLFAYFLLQSVRLDEMNSDSAVPGLNRNEAHAAEVKLPAAASLLSFTSSMNPVFQLATQSERENVTLAATRDALLPQLMSGKLRVKDAETLISV